MSEFINFLWVAFHDYFLVWVAGGSIVGIILAGVALWERYQGVPVRKSLYFGILAIALVVGATFSAWHDSQKNLKAVIEQRATDTSQLGTCKSDLQNQRTLTTSWQERFADQQKTINALQEPQLKQQATINSCVVSLGKMNPLVRRDIRVLVTPIFIRDPHSTRIVDESFPGAAQVSEMVITTNQEEPRASGNLSCDKDFVIDRLPALPFATGKTFIGGITPNRISGHEYWISVPTVYTHWGPTTPILLGITTTMVDRPSCTFKTQ